jgi:hypothetical protein
VRQSCRADIFVDALLGQLEGLVYDILDIGKTLLRPPRASQSSQPKPAERSVVDPRQAQEAVLYLQRAYALTEKADTRPKDDVLGTNVRDALQELKVNQTRDCS